MPRPCCSVPLLWFLCVFLILYSQLTLDMTRPAIFAATFFGSKLLITKHHNGADGFSNLRIRLESQRSPIVSLRPTSCIISIMALLQVNPRTIIAFTISELEGDVGGVLTGRDFLPAGHVGFLVA